MYTIETFHDINNHDLKNGWIKLQNEIDAFPQMHYEWIEPWWAANNKSQELYIITVLDSNNSIVGIAPFCIQKKGMVKVLRSIPIHFGDFYSFISNNKAVNELIIDKISEFKKWNIIHIFNINSENPLIKSFENRKFQTREIVEILSPKFENNNFEEFLQSISKNSRSQYKKKLKRLDKKGKVDFVEVNTWEGYLANFTSLKDIYNLRREADERPFLSDSYYEMRNKALKPMFENGKSVLYLLKLDDELIAFRLGFINNKTYYDWKVSHNPEFNYYSPGFLTVGLIIEHLISNNNKEFNFMTGNYQYKRSWTNNNDENVNLEVFHSKKWSFGYLYQKYRMKYREIIKAIYTSLKKRKK